MTLSIAPAPAFRVASPSVRLGRATDQAFPASEQPAQKDRYETALLTAANVVQSMTVQDVLETPGASLQAEITYDGIRSVASMHIVSDSTCVGGIMNQFSITPLNRRNLQGLEVFESDAGATVLGYDRDGGHRELTDPEKGTAIAARNQIIARMVELSPTQISYGDWLKRMLAAYVPSLKGKGDALPA
ncbi:MAG: hypothetical protein IPK79_11100 [Vampirovibrionales bacterium]|nr:hypothetical protein [Vampirovibrionales bacterium]